MFNKIRNTLAGLIGAATLLAVPLTVPVLASAATTNSIGNCVAQGTNLDATGAINGICSGNTNTSTGGANLTGIIKTIINVLSVVVGVVAVVMIIFGGLRYITSGGDSGNVSNAKNTIIYAIIGLVIVAMAQFIVQFVLNKVTTT